MPPLPGWHWHSGKYTDNQMHAYARAYAAEQTRELVEALERIARRLQADVDDGSRPDQWSMEDLIRVANTAIAKHKGQA